MQTLNHQHIAHRLNRRAELARYNERRNADRSLRPLFYIVFASAAIEVGLALIWWAK